MIHDTQNAQISQKHDGRNIYVIMKTMCPPGYHHNGFMATHALGHNFSNQGKRERSFPPSFLYLRQMFVIINLNPRAPCLWRARCQQKMFLRSIFVDIKLIRDNHPWSHNLFILNCGCHKEGSSSSPSVNIIIN